MQFSDSVNKTGLYELFQDLVKTNTTDYPVAKFARDANNAFAQFMMLAIMASQKWQADDTNQTDYPIVTINLVSGQQDYPFTTDNSTVPNQILDITRIECASSSGLFNVLDPYDQDDEKRSLTQLATATGTPRRYDLLANGIFLDPPPNYSYANGLKVWFQRTGVYFISTDTTKKAGIPDMFHEYLVYRPAYLYAITNLPKLAAGYLNFLTKMEGDIQRYYNFRNKNQRKNITANVENMR